MMLFNQIDMYNTMPELESDIQRLIRSVGTIRIDQILEYFALTSELEKKACLYYLQDLLKRKDRIILTDDIYITDYGIGKPDYQRAECMWDVIGSLDIVKPNTLDSAEEPAGLFYETTKNETRIATFITASNINTVMYLQERFYSRQTVYKREKLEKGVDVRKSVRNVFVVNNMKIANFIVSSCKLTMPFIICDVEYPDGDMKRPTIKYYYSKTKEVKKEQEGENKQ